MEKVREAAAGISQQRDSGNGSKPQKGNETSAAFWPLIRQVNVRCSARALSTGAILVDLPGVYSALQGKLLN